MEVLDCIVKISQGTEPAFSPDKRGNFPLVLQNLGGKMPVSLSKTGEKSSIHLLNGTSALLKGIEPEKTYLVQFTNLGVQQYKKSNGEVVSSDNWDVIVQMPINNPVELLQAKSFVGKAVNLLVKETPVDENSGVETVEEGVEETVEEIEEEVEGMN